MKPAPRRPGCRGLTLAELLVAMVVAAVLATVAAPMLIDFVRMQRLKSVHANVVTDMQFARAEAAARGEFVRISFRFQTTSPALTCYTIYTSPANGTRCDCRLGAGSACSGSMREIKTVTALNSDHVSIRQQTGIGQDTAFAFDHVAGGLVAIPTDTDTTPLESYSIQTQFPDSSHALRVVLNAAGRPTVCTPTGNVPGVETC
jgi:type IV fimbrial biogenesis protein FimT